MNVVRTRRAGQYEHSGRRRKLGTSVPLSCPGPHHAVLFASVQLTDDRSDPVEDETLVCVEGMPVPRITKLR
jgi:hypothetical protein